MLITKKTKWKHIAPLINTTNFDKLLEQCPEHPLPRKVIDLTCGEFIGLLENDNHIAEQVVGRPKLALVMLGRLRSLKRQMDEVRAYLTANEYQQDMMAEKAANGVKFPTPSERILLDVQQRYGLKSLNDAEKAPLTDYMLMVRDQTSRAKFEHNLNILQSRKYKKK